MDPFVHQLELAWAAGFFDGEGSVYLRQSHTRKYFYPTLAISQTDLEVLVRFQKAVGVGKLYSPSKNYQTKPGCRLIHQFRVGKKADIRKIYDQISPYLGRVKLAQFQHVFEVTDGVKEYNSFTEQDVLQIREKYANGNVSMRLLAQEYSTSTSYISGLVNRKYWSNV